MRGIFRFLCVNYYALWREYKFNYNFLWRTHRYSTAAPLYSCRSHSTCSTKFSTEYPGTVRVLHVSKRKTYIWVLVPLPHIPLLDLIKNISRLAKQLQLDVVIHLPLEFAIRRHLTVEISASAQLHPRVPRVPRAVVHE